MKHKIGDIVTIRKDMEVGNTYGDIYFSPLMREAIGKSYTITHYLGDEHYIIDYHDTTLDYDWVFSSDMFEQEGEAVLTEPEKIILSNIHPKFKYIVRTTQGELFLYLEKPQKRGNVWWVTSTMSRLEAFEHLFKCVSSNDNEATSIDKLRAI